MIRFDEYFSNGLVQPPSRFVYGQRFQGSTGKLVGFLWFWTNKTPVFESHKNANVTKMNASCEINNLSLVGKIGEQLL